MGSDKKLIFVLTITLLMASQARAGDVVRYKFSRAVYADDAGKGFRNPEGIACGNNGIAVADTGNGRLVLFPMQKGEPGVGREVRLPEIVYPMRVLMGSQGDLFVLDSKQRKVVHLSGEGTFLNYIDTTKAPADGMLFPVAIGLDGADKLYLLDLSGNRVLVFGSDGSFARQISFPGVFGFITDLAVDRRGTVFLVDSVKGIVYSTEKDPAVFSPLREKLKEEMKFPSNIMVDERSLLYVTDQHGGGIVVLDRDGTARRLFTMGWKDGALRYPAQVCVTSEAVLVVADRSNSRLQVFTPLK